MDEVKFAITDDVNHGVVVSVFDTEIADYFDDFLSENYYIFYNIKEHGGYIQFFFGYASSIEKIRLLIDVFSKNKEC